MPALIRQIFRGFPKSPGFVAVVVLTLAFGIGANTAIFSLFDQVMLRLLPVEHPEELVVIDTPGRRASGFSISDNSPTVRSFPMYENIKRRAKGFQGVIARSSADVVLGHGGQTERAGAEIVSGNFFDVLGARPALGRVLHPADDEVEGGHPGAVLSHGCWKSRFGGRPGVVGETITVNGHPMEVVGVSEAAFQGVLLGRTPDIYVPLAMRRQVRPGIFLDNMSQRRRVHWLSIIARLEPDAAAARVEAALQPVLRSTLEDELTELGSRAPRSREEFLDRKVKLTPAPQGVSDLSQRLKTPLFSMLALVGVVLLIACVNIAGLLLARAVGRSRDVAVRLALGAGRWVLVRQFLLESLILALAGGAVGVIVASWSMQLLETFVPDSVGRLLAPELDARMLFYNFTLATLTGVVFGLWPAFQATRALAIDSLKDQSAGGGESRRHVRLRVGSVVVQVA